MVYNNKDQFLHAFENLKHPEKMDITNYKGDISPGKKRVKDRLLSLSSENRKKIIEFIERLGAEGLSFSRRLKYIYWLTRLGIMLDMDFSKANKKDMYRLVNKIETMETKNGKPISEWTKHDLKVFLKRFYKWMRRDEGMKLSKHQFPDEVDWITPTIKNNKKKLPKDLLTIDDINKLADNANNLRDKCFIHTLYESGARIGEIMNLKIRDIEFTTNGCKILLNGKTGERYVPLISSAPVLSRWINEHPQRNNKNASLFCGIWSKNKGKPIEYQTFRLMLRDVKKKTNIDKPVNPHHFRHSRATFLAGRKEFNEATLCYYMGWEIGSKQAATYVHLSGKSVNDAVNGMYGIKQDDESNNIGGPIKCPRCGYSNEPSAKFCNQCMMGLDTKTMMHFDKKKDEVVSTSMDDSKLDAILKTVQKLDEENKSLRKKVEKLESQ